MRINKLSLKNFQGLKDFTLAPYGSDIEVRGENATGKTTIGNAITWLLYGKPLDGAKNFNPKPKEADGEDAHFVEPSVTAEIDVAGEVSVIKKVLKENWQKTKGASEKEYKGNTTDYFKNEVPITAKKFQDYIDTICPPDWVRILTSPFYFAEELPWQDRRNKLLEMCGDIGDAEVIAASPELTELSELLKIPGTTDEKYAMEDLLAIKKVQMKKINEQLQAVPVRIDEAEKAAPDIKGLTKKGLNDALKEAKEQKGDLERQRAALSLNTVKTQLETELNRMTMEQARQKLEYEGKENKKVHEAREIKFREEKVLRDLEAQKTQYENALKEEKRVFENMNRAREALMKEHAEIAAEQFVCEDTCPTCGQPLPPEKIQEAQERWNKQKSERLASITAKGQAECSLKKIAEIALRIKGFEKKMKEIAPKIEAQKSIIEAVAIPNLSNFEETEAAQTLSTEIARIKEKIAYGNIDIEKEEAPILEAISAVDESIALYESKLRDIDAAKNQKKRVEELKQEEKDLSAAYEEAEKAVFLCERFIQEKARLLTDSINARFETVRFRLFDTQINGGIKECCDVLVAGKDGLVPFNTANNAGKVNAGIELINAFSEHTGYHVPLIIDNAESVIQILPSKNQMVKLIVDENAKELQIL